jgi:DNA modification methylase
MDMPEQLYLFDADVKTRQRKQSSTTFIDNMKLPVHRWFRYSAGFSALWVKETLRHYAQDKSMILDPFAGSGTTLVAANEMGLPSTGFEKQYFVNRIAAIKLRYTFTIDHARKLYNEIIYVLFQKISILKNSRNC